jgi:hypothetical protein
MLGDRANRLAFMRYKRHTGQRDEIIGAAMSPTRKPATR